MNGLFSKSCIQPQLRDSSFQSLDINFDIKTENTNVLTQAWTTELIFWNRQWLSQKCKSKRHLKSCEFLGSIFTDVHVRIFWRSYSKTSWDFTREMKEENWNFKTPLTHGLRHFWAKTLKSKWKLIKKGLDFMLSDSQKSAFKMASEYPQKIIAKKYEKHEIVRLL